MWLRVSMCYSFLLMGRAIADESPLPPCWLVSAPPGLEVHAATCMGLA